jgi:hypothetical protein
MNRALHPFRTLTTGLLASLLLLLTSPARAATNVVIAPPPDWVTTLPWDARAERAPNQKSEGTRYLLYETQAHAQRAEEFTRVAVLMENETGVQDSGSLSFYFDPSFQQLFLHQIQIHRNGGVLNRLDAAKIKTIQSEPGLDGHMLTGQQSALVFVEDLRVGDVLEYSYTRRGANPILAGHFSSRFSVQFGVPVNRYQIRLLWADPAPLQVRTHLTEATPARSLAAGLAEYVWDFTNLTAIDYEDYLPPSYEPAPYVEVSDFADWARVVDWALPLYARPQTPLPAELAALVESWKKAEPTAAGRMLRALQFVQDDIRYTGLELGPDSYRPTPPFETFEKRYGDCKGKVLLLCTLADALGCEAWPALVNSRFQAAIARRLPSPFAFNHVIVKLRLDGVTYWVDPTDSHQGGDLARRNLSRFGRALVVQPGVTDLEEVPLPRQPTTRQHLLSTFRLKDYESPAELTVRTTYRGAGADGMREQLARTDPKDLGKEYLNFYARYYAGIEPVNSPEVKDDRANNVITLSEAYRIRDLWKRNAETGKREATFWAESLYTALIEPTTRIRKMPLRITHPRRYEHDLVIRLPDRDWKIPDSTESVEHAAFRFDRKRTLTGATLKYTMACETRREEIPAEQVADYLAKCAEMEESLGETLFRADPGLAGPTDVNWAMVGVGLIALLITAAGLTGAGIWVWVRQAHTPPLPPPLPDEVRLRGLGGWLILVGIGLCLGPFVQGFQLAQGWESFFSLATWRNVTTPGGESYHPLFGPTLVLELAGNIFLTGVSLLAVSLFFLKHRAFPRVYIALLAGNAVFLLLDYLLVAQISTADPAAVRDSMRNCTRAMVGALIWISYTLRSKRVRHTFVR